MLIPDAHNPRPGCQKVDSERADHPFAVKRCVRIVGITEDPVPKLVRQRHAPPACRDITVHHSDTDGRNSVPNLNATTVDSTLTQRRRERVQPQPFAGSPQIVDGTGIQTVGSMSVVDLNDNPVEESTPSGRG